MSFYRKILNNLVDPVLRPWARKFANLQNTPRRLESLENRYWMLAGELARARHPELAGSPAAEGGIRRHETSVFSQQGEDGILLHLFSEIGATNRRFVECGIEDGTECNTANLAIHFGFSGLMLDADAAGVERARWFFRSMLGDHAGRVTIDQSWITAENINQTLTRHGMEGSIDLLSIDIDGNDYWVWKAISAVAPRAVVIEYNAALGPERSCTIPYDPGFDRWKAHPSGFYFGASLCALTKLAEQKGYALVGGESAGRNAFFVREDLITPGLPPVHPRDAHVHLACRARRGISIEQQTSVLNVLPWEEV